MMVSVISGSRICSRCPACTLIGIGIGIAIWIEIGIGCNFGFEGKVFPEFA